MDVRSRLSDDLLPFLAAAHGRIPTDDSLVQFRDNADLDRIVQLLTVEWDRRMARDSAGALAWQLFMHFVTEGALKDDILLGYSTAMELMTIFVVKVAAMAIEGEYPTGDAVLQEGRDVILLNAAVKAADWINDRYGDVEPAGYAYRDMKFTSFDEAFGMGMPVFTRPTDGGEDTLCVSTNISFSPWADRWVSNYVSVERTIGEFAADGTPVVYVTYPVGNLADPNSGDTQAANADYIEGRYRRFLFSRDEIEGALRDRIVLTRE
jgi:acyl-homoserine lactone acylase PvdQ